MYLIFLLSILVGCSTIDDVETPKFHWELLVSGHSYPNIEFGKQLDIPPLSCTMDKGTKSVRDPWTMPVRWLQCSDSSGLTVRIMPVCRHNARDSQRLMLVSSDTGRLRKLIELVCTRML